jgi:hypothetical protein
LRSRKAKRKMRRKWRSKKLLEGPSLKALDLDTVRLVRSVRKSLESQLQALTISSVSKLISRIS